MKGFARFIVATMAGAGLGASAALAKRHLLSPPPAVKDPAPAAPAAAQTAPVSPPQVASAPAAPAQERTEPRRFVRSAEDTADLDAARIRLRERAAALRAEMEGRAGVP